jgi:dolichol-phosphate mannosyltransferase
MTQTGEVLVTVATYNERDNLPELVAEIFRQLPQADLLVVDDNSPDGTGAWCDEHARDEPRLRCLHRRGKLGLGTATIAAMKYAIEHGYRYMINMDADFSHPPQYLPALLAGMESADGHAADVAIGSRYVPGGAIEGWPPLRHCMSRGVNLYARWLLGLKARDCSGAYRCYRVERLRQLDFDQILSTGYSFQEEVLFHLQRLGCRFAEIPIVFVDRKRGQSKINLSEAFRALGIIFLLAMRRLRPAKGRPAGAGTPGGSDAGGRPGRDEPAD